MIITRGYVKFLEVIAHTDCEIPHYKVPRDGFLAHVDEVVKKGTYVGTVEFTEICETEKVKDENYANRYIR